MRKREILALFMAVSAVGCTREVLGSCEVSPITSSVSLNAELTAEQKAFFTKNYLPCKQRNKKKNPDALFNVGVAVLHGLGTNKDPSKAFLWFKGAADKDHKASQRILAQMFSQGVGIFRDPQIAQKYEAASRIRNAVD
jgi:TPR repeat protein